MQQNDKKTWSGRFAEPVSDLVKRYTASVNFDKRLAEVDIQGSLAHAKMLNKVGVLADAEHPPQPVHLVVQPSRMPAPKVRAFLDFAAPRLRAEFGRLAAEARRLVPD